MFRKLSSNAFFYAVFSFLLIFSFSVEVFAVTGNGTQETARNGHLEVKEAYFYDPNKELLTEEQIVNSDTDQYNVTLRIYDNNKLKWAEAGEKVDIALKDFDGTVLFKKTFYTNNSGYVYGHILTSELPEEFYLDVYMEAKVIKINGVASDVYTSPNFSIDLLKEEPIDNELEDNVIHPITLNPIERDRMLKLGFSENELNTITQEEYSNYINLSGDLVSVEDTYVKTIYNQTTDTVSAEKVTEQQALNELQMATASAITCRKPNDCVQNTSWMRMRTTASKTKIGSVLIKNSFQWLKNPNFTMTDAVALTHSTSVAKIPSSVKFSYKYTDTRGVHSVKPKQIIVDPVGMAATFNLKTYGSNTAPRNHNGYISYEVLPQNKYDVKANVYGHYTHTEISILGIGLSVALKSGSMSITGVAKTTKMPDTYILFNW
ncbi:hypothetical protein [Bacillus sp. SJS]|uniref:hypothetical protein n=1 Tax=Bacillus sp. SJS TaxID=1423321 RepID=UPI0004DCC754|nr:hypothetical protein [Bacillus sp. SJS]KZZ84523.1 hypothetical protein AS29_010135 [Bacillus sp. SJS]